MTGDKEENREKEMAIRFQLIALSTTFANLSKDYMSTLLKLIHWLHSEFTPNISYSFIDSTNICFMESANPQVFPLLLIVCENVTRNNTCKVCF